MPSIERIERIEEAMEEEEELEYKEMNEEQQAEVVRETTQKFIHAQRERIMVGPESLRFLFFCLASYETVFDDPGLCLLMMTPQDCQRVFGIKSVNSYFVHDKTTKQNVGAIIYDGNGEMFYKKFTNGEEIVYKIGNIFTIHHAHVFSLCDTLRRL
jgi:hypothetical protein